MAHVKYFWDEIEDNVIREYDESDNTIAHYTTEPTRYGSVISQERSGVTRYYHFDGQGNTTELTDTSGNVTDTRKYSAFGEVTESTGTTEFPYEYGGRWGYLAWGNSQQFSIRRRAFSADCARWLSTDPVHYVIDANLYRFVDSNPINATDPSGLLIFRDCRGATCCWSNACRVWLVIRAPAKCLREQIIDNILNGRPPLDPIDSGHAYLWSDCPGYSFATGLYQISGGNLMNSPCELLDDSNCPNPTHFKEYRVCPETAAILKALMEDFYLRFVNEAPRVQPKYNAFDCSPFDDTYTCVTWALEMLRNACIESKWPEDVEPFGLPKSCLGVLPIASRGNQ